MGYPHGVGRRIHHQGLRIECERYGDQDGWDGRGAALVRITASQGVTGLSLGELKRRNRTLGMQHAEQQQDQQQSG